MKKMFLMGAAGLLAVGLWNATDLHSCLLRMKQRHAEKQKADLVENWEVHFDAELARMQDSEKDLGRKIYKQKVKVEKTRIEVDGLKKKEQDYDVLVRSFVERMKAAQSNVSGGATFTFAGRPYGADEAEAQLRRYLAEIKSLRSRIEHLEELQRAQTQVVDGYEEGRRKLQGQISELRIKREEYALERDLLAVRTEIEKTRELAEKAGSGEGRCGADRMKVLVEAMDEAMLDKKAELAISREDEAEGAPLSLSETAHRIEDEGRSDDLDELRRAYWNGVEVR